MSLRVCNYISGFLFFYVICHNAKIFRAPKTKNYNTQMQPPEEIHSALGPASRYTDQDAVKSDYAVQMLEMTVLDYRRFRCPCGNRWYGKATRRGFAKCKAHACRTVGMEITPENNKDWGAFECTKCDAVFILDNVMMKTRRKCVVGTCGTRLQPKIISSKAIVNTWLSRKNACRVFEASQFDSSDLLSPAKMIVTRQNLYVRFHCARCDKRWYTLDIGLPTKMCHTEECKGNHATVIPRESNFDMGCYDCQCGWFWIENNVTAETQSLCRREACNKVSYPVFVGTYITAFRWYASKFDYINAKLFDSTDPIHIEELRVQREHYSREKEIQQSRKVIISK
jgi:hypothetical protein